MKTGLMFDVLWVISFVGCCQLDDFCFVGMGVSVGVGVGEVVVVLYEFEFS